MTIRPLFSTTVAAVFALALCATSAHAQSTNQFHLSLGGGLSVPTGDFGSSTDNGYNLVVGVSAHQPNQALGLRAEGFFNQFNSNEFSDTHLQVGGITGNATYDFNLGSMSGGRRGRARNNADNGGLYAIGGLGWYQAKVTTDNFGDLSSENHLGWNIGGGFRFPLSGFSAYIEARYNSMNLNGGSTLSFVPITVGLVF
jgi:hypothetical protein